MLQGGNELCRIEGFDRGKAVSELKVSIEAEAGLVPALARLINPESHVELQDHLTLEDAGMQSELALTEGVIQLYAQKLKKVIVADELQIAPGKVTDSELAVLCDSIKDDPPDIVVLCGCRRVTNISCLVQLSTISYLDISGCNLGGVGFHLAGVTNNGGKGGFHLAGVIKDMGALTSLNLASTGIGGYEDGEGNFIATPEGIATLYCAYPTHCFSYRSLLTSGPAAIADAIKDMGALTKLDISSCNLRTQGTKLLAEALRGNQFMTELNISSNQMTWDDISGVIAITDAISDMGAMLSLDMSGNSLNVNSDSSMDYLGPAVAASTITSLNIANNYLNQNGGIEAVASLLDKGALTKLDISNNYISEVCNTKGIELDNHQSESESEDDYDYWEDIRLIDNRAALISENSRQQRQ
jgi:hypothetical protein